MAISSGMTIEIVGNPRGATGHSNKKGNNFLGSSFRQGMKDARSASRPTGIALTASSQVASARQHGPHHQVPSRP
jgi:hypothetical protein